MTNEQIKVNIFYWTFDLPVKLRLCERLPTEEEFKKYYVSVCTMTLDTHDCDDLYDQLQEILELFSSQTENPLKKSQFHEQWIRDNKLHFTMGMSDIIKFDDTYYFITNNGFKMICW